MKYLVGEGVDEIEMAYITVRSDLSDLITNIVLLGDKLKNAKAQSYCRYGLGRRASNIKRCLDRFYDIFGLESDGKSVSDDQRFDQTAFLTFFFINVAGGFDNLAWVFNHEMNLNLDKRKVGLFFREFQTHLRPDFVAAISSFKEWQEQHLKDFRDAAAHRISPYVVPYQQNEQGQQVYDSIYIHDFEESRPMLLHPQVLADAGAFIQVTKAGLDVLSMLQM